MTAPYRIAVVCLGNICRSPTAHVVLRHRVTNAGLDDRVEVESAGTGRWEIGNPIDSRAARLLREQGYAIGDHAAQQFTSDWFERHDLVLAMDSSNYADLASVARTEDDLAKLRMFRSFDPQVSDDDNEVPDPWYGGADGFVEVLGMIERASDAIVSQLADRLAETG